MQVTGGSTDVTTYFVLRLAADGTEATGLTITNFDLQYVRSGVAPTAKVDVTALAQTDSTHADNKAIEIDATDQPGLYRVDWPDAAFAAGVKEVILTVKCATAFTEHLRVSIDPPVNVTSLSADQQSLTDLKDFADAGYDPGTNKVQGVVLTDALTTYTGNTLQTGNVATLITTVGVAGAGLTAAGGDGSQLTAINLPNQTMDITGNITGNLSGSVGSVTGLTASNLDATISSRMATYTQPTGFLAVTFPGGTVANTTNITAGVMTTTTNLTNLPAAAALEATSQSIKTKTDSLTFTTANVVDANIQQVNNVTIVGDGSATPYNV